MSESLRLRSLLVASVSAAAMLGVAAPAFAQDTTVGEVVVTAQKKEEAIQDVPIAVSAFSADSLEKAKIDGGPNLVLAVPNVSFSKGNFTGYNFQIRGIGAKLVSGSGDAGTGIHLNNAPLTANNLFEAEFFDVERVEVLRGPQGTLYGRNATGGVVNLITAQPTDEFDASIRLEAGNFGSKKVRGMVNIPLGDTLALRVAGAMLQRDGYGLNIQTGSDVDDRDLWNTRATLAWTPTDTFRATLLWDHFKEDDARSRIGKGLCVKDPGPATGIGATNFSAANGGLNGIIQRGALTQGCKPVAASDPNILGTVNTQGTLAGVFGAFYGLQTGDASAGQIQDQNVRHIQSYLDPIYRAETDIVQFNISWDLTDSLQLTSLTGYSENSLYTQQDYARIIPTGTFNAPGPMGPNPVNALAALGPAYNALYAALFPGGVISDPQVGARNRISTIDVSSGEGQNFSQELRLQSNFAGPVNFNIGAIYLDFVGDGHYTVMGNTLTAAIQIENNLSDPPVAALLACSVGTPCYIDPNAEPNFQGHNYFDNTGEYHLKSRALFGEVYWQVTDTFKLTGGLRYTHDMKRQEVRPNQLFSSGPPGVPLLASQPYLTADFKEMTGRLGFDWKPDLSFTDESLIYLFYSRGYKAGGMNPQCSSTSGLICPPPTFEPEFVNAWELGMKNTLMGGAMVLNLTGFKYDYIGYQVSKIVNRSATNENIDAEIKGLELETVWSPFDGFRINMAVGYLATEITSGKSVDVFDPTGGNPLLTLVKASSGANCVVSTAQAQAVLGVSNFLGNPFAMYGICSSGAPSTTTVYAAGAGPALIAGGPLAASSHNGFAAAGIPLIYVSDGVETDLAGKELPNTPHYTFSLGAQYAWTVGGGWDATVRADYYRQTDSFARMYNTAADVLEGWENVNATITLGNYEAGWSVEIYGKNLMDETVLTDTYLGDASAGMVRNGFYGEPRTYGMAVTKTF